MTTYIPERGDLMWLTLDPQAGHEQAGRRPVLVLSPQNYNRRSGLVLISPVTNQIKNYPYEVKLPSGLAVTGVILADQVKNQDWQARKATFITPVPQEVIEEVLAKLNTLLR